MGMSVAMLNALSGLTAVSRGIEVVSSNVSNAQTEGYAKRELVLSAQQLGKSGAGVTVVGVSRVVNQQVLGDLRLADASAAAQDTRLTFAQRFADQLGEAGDEYSLSSRIASLEAALTEAAALPDSTTRLNAVAQAAGDIADQLNAASDDVQAARMEADQNIADTVATLNDNLVKIRDLNVAIQQGKTSNQDTSGLEDQRQVLIDQVAAVVPLKELPRENGMVALVTTGGAVLLDGKPAEIGFSPAGLITPDMTVESGALSGLTLNGKPITMTAQGEGMLGGGTLGALFDVRDNLAPQAQATLDALARDLYERFADPTIDPTIATGDPGLFTDAGGAFDTADEVGLAGRLSLNALVDPGQGGASWRLRAGIYATAPNSASDATLLNAMSDALTATRVPSSGPFGSTARSAGDLADQASSIASGNATSLEKTVTYTQSRADSLRAMFLSDGVDSDAEMQNLLVLQQAYAANARVISTIDTLMQTLLEI